MYIFICVKGYPSLKVYNVVVQRSEECYAEGLMCEKREKHNTEKHKEKNIFNSFAIYLFLFVVVCFYYIYFRFCVLLSVCFIEIHIYTHTQENTLRRKSLRFSHLKQ